MFERNDFLRPALLFERTVARAAPPPPAGLESPREAGRLPAPLADFLPVPGLTEAGLLSDERPPVRTAGDEALATTRFGLDISSRERGAAVARDRIGMPVAFDELHS